ncbi:MAG: helix-turn-helix transcriptional regulator [Lachnospiraceae bacterium]|nr:helix-turn-helix transcriptional regulator [Lachnospiraceae bacterium]
MMHAYDKMYLEKGRNALARMLDFAVYQLKYDIDTYVDMFIASGISRRFEHGDVSLIVGKSGVEITYEVLYESLGGVERVYVEYTANRSPEYWAGWALAYYQWLKGLSFADIVKVVPLSRIVSMYPTYHEMDIRQFVDKMDEMCEQHTFDTKLKQRRKLADMSQSQLSEATGVSVRTIQQYEQRQKDVSKANVSTLAKFARALYCDITDLIDEIK